MVLGTVWDILYAKIFVANISLSPALIFFVPISSLALDSYLFSCSLTPLYSL